MKAVEWEAPGRLRLTERAEPRPEPGQAVVAVAACGICGSDLHSYRGTIPTSAPAAPPTPQSSPARPGRR
jgi:(R,R)-butanediol dehydrogenase/meso-butanediol dehydrogenase/diacetyl reductase